MDTETKSLKDTPAAVTAKRWMWITPLKKQCFVTLGVSLNMMAHGLVMGFAAILLPSLKAENSPIPINDTSGSWIASILGFALVAGNFINPSIMSRYGRRVANLTSIIPLITGWVIIIFAVNIPMLLVARFLQGISMGMSSSLGPVLIGEYTSPKNRGAFLTTISVAIATGVLIVHTLGSYITWKKTALICCTIALTDLCIVFYSPESPSFLADKRRFEECRSVFRWLRGDDENEELENMIRATQEMIEVNKPQSLKKKIREFIKNVNITIRKRDFYKPIILMMVIYTMGQWAGANLLAAYIQDIVHGVIGDDFNIPILIITIDVQRIISNTCAVYVIKKVKRRTMLFATGGLNVFAFLATALYVYAKTNNFLPFNQPIVGALLIHLHMFTIATGMVPLPFIIAGEVFPLRYRSLAGGISVLFLSSNLFITVKTASWLFKVIGLWGAYILYAGVVGLCLCVAAVLMPETKDRTLQDIEDEFRGRPLSPEEIKSIESLTSMKFYKLDRRCSSPVI
ncbi:Facilitated trehalose transporter Tret1 [Eumeta japonica]|uniref:Facilitated trehalose transporter Tret1 n=1 Tax=Eumeta variegata TaxID=151549 RepID=A0A4C1SU76_EUMVA|nr:Facilitated trehalose transporter Tret1 [Eumeta japonica]